MSTSPNLPRVSDPSTKLLSPASDLPSSPSMSSRAHVHNAYESAAIHYNTALSLSAASSARRSFFLNQLLVICGGCNAADAVEILTVSFILPSATDELGLSGTQKGWLTAMIFVGMMLGGWLWGSLSDKYGRRRCLIACLVINGVGGLLSAIAPNFGLILLFRFFSGIGVGGSVPVVFTYFSEFLCTRDRGPYMVAIACCWMIGSLFTAGLAWLVVPQQLSFSIGFMDNVHSWRLFAFLCGWPSLFCAMALVFAPESPRWLLSQGRNDEAKAILVRLYEVNHVAGMAYTMAGAADNGVQEVVANPDQISVEQESEAVSLHRNAHGLATEEYAMKLSRASHSWVHACCGMCLSRRKRHPAARKYRAVPPPLLGDSNHAASPSSRSSSSESIRKSSLSGRKDSVEQDHDGDATSSSSQQQQQKQHQGDHGIRYSMLNAAAPLSDAHVASSRISSSPALTAQASSRSSIPPDHLAVLLPGHEHALSSPSSEHFPKGALHSHAAVDVSSDPSSPSSASPPLTNPDDSSASSAAGAFVEADYLLMREDERWRSFVTQMARLDSVPVLLDEEAEYDEANAALAGALDTPGATAATPASISAALRSPSAAALSDAQSNPTCCTRVAVSCSTTWSSLRMVLRKTASLFSSDARHAAISGGGGGLRVISFKLLCTWFFLAFGYYGLTMWMPTYFQDQDDQGAASGSSGGGGEDSDGNLTYVTSVIGSLSALPANIASVFTVRIYGRVKTIVVSLLLSAVCVLLVPFVHSSAGSVVLLCIFSGVNTAAWNALNISTTELYKTEVRATAFGFFAASGRLGAILGNLMFGELMGAGNVLPLLITGGSLVAAAVAAFLLPETKSSNLS